MSNIYFPKKSHHGYFDTIFQRHFYSKKEKEAFMNKYGFVEGDSASRAHMKRVREFVRYNKEETRKNPDFKYKGDYPD